MRKVLVEARQLHPPPPPPSSSSEEGVESEGKLCLICMDKVINTIILPCGHQVNNYLFGVGPYNICYQIILLL